MWGFSELLQVFSENGLGEAGSFSSLELNVFAEHPGQGRLGWAGAQGKKSRNLVLTELGQRLVLQVKHDSSGTKYTGDQKNLTR